MENKSIIFNREWAMPNSNTFDIRPINELIYRYFKDEYISLDLFANKSKICKITNDLDPSMNTTYNMDALDCLKQFENQ
jgi:hypothetical protein